jgi:hypothetical protein
MVIIANIIYLKLLKCVIGLLLVLEWANWCCVTIRSTMLYAFGGLSMIICCPSIQLYIAYYMALFRLEMVEI